MSDGEERGYIQRLVGNVRILVLGSRMLTEAEFDAHIVEAVNMAGSVRAVILSVLGSPPMSAERRAKLDRAGLVRVPTAVLTESVLVRAILTALRWLGGDARPFPMDAELRACEFLGVPVDSRPAVVRELRAMIAELTGRARPVHESSARGLVHALERLERVVGARTDRIRKHGER
jgi:hypothetical protein